ncbi:HK97-gp10 family putative phage morphogenesis protein [Salisediminibacterium selenitireducens]|uniref:Phage protein, HK97 gp10 family n=1 Tax=Bacillus selenitireducens (strain ATCC 700615 / DSM 15326 / MLS10) TaxID=439292 RepID=D6XZY1_BACIE|nr:HK97-gp10 family putative phage morphogenesis protein [Salisediminibacterium selenitireducens]ADI00483.1 phage protein, HK97 gp10 family [[Bacillus] selenitireducens MLS10]
MKVEMTGMDEVLRNLDAMGQRGRRIENKALREAGKMVQEAIQKETPEDSGTLKRSIQVSNVKTKDGMKHVLVGPDKTGWYGSFVEFGTVKMRATPFMGRGYEQVKGNVITTILLEMRKGMGL